MKKIMKLFTIIITLAVATSASAARDYSRPERKEMSPEEKECIEDYQKFVRSYEIITSLYDRVLKETGDIPHSMVMDKADADRLYG